MPLQLLIFKSNKPYIGIKLFCWNSMFVEDFNSLSLRLRCSVIIRRRLITKVLAIDNSLLSDLTPRARVPGDHTSLVSL